jgi:hypothetical protein
MQTVESLLASPTERGTLLIPNGRGLIVKPISSDYGQLRAGR